MQYPRKGKPRWVTSAMVTRISRTPSTASASGRVGMTTQSLATSPLMCSTSSEGARSITTAS